MSIFSEKILDLDDKPFDDSTVMASNGYLSAAQREADAKTPAERDAARKEMDKLKVPLTLGLVCRHALSANFQDEQGVAAEKKFERGMLAYKIAKGEIQALSAEEITLIKPLIGKFYGPVVVLRAFMLLDPVGAEKASGKAKKK